MLTKKQADLFNEIEFTLSKLKAEMSKSPIDPRPVGFLLVNYDKGSIDQQFFFAENLARAESHRLLAKGFSNLKILPLYTKD